MALLHRVADERVLGLQIEDVELVDARRDEQEGPLMHLGRQRLVFDELEQLVLVHHRALGRGHVAAHLEQALVGHRHMALAHVVQQVGQPWAMLSPWFRWLLLRLGIEGQVVARRHGGDPLLYRETDAGTGLGVGFHRIGQAHEGAGIEQVGRCREGGHRVAGPAVAPKRLSAGFSGAPCGPLQPELAGLFHVLRLQRLDLVGRQLEGRNIARRGGSLDALERLQRALPGFAKDLLELLGALRPECVRIMLSPGVVQSPPAAGLSPEFADLAGMCWYGNPPFLH